MKVLSAFFTAFLPFAASAQNAEFFHQPNAGVTELTAHVGYRTSTSSNVAANTAETNLNGLDRIGFKSTYGANPLIALGFDLSYSTFKTNNAGADLRGWEPLRLFLNGQLPLAMGSFQYGFDVSFGLEKAQVQTGLVNRSYGDLFGDLPAGGLKVAPYLGALFNLGATGFAGARLSYEFVNSDTKAENATGEVTYGGGAQGQLALFYETKITDLSLGAALTYDWFSRATLQSAGVESTVQNAHSLIGTRFYATVPWIEGCDFLPSIVWREKASGDDFGKTSDIRFVIAGRFAF